MKNKALKDWVFLSIQLFIFLMYLNDVPFLEWEISKDQKIFFQLIASVGFLWVLLAIMSMNTLVSPFPSPKEGMQLQTKGVYAFSRHPIYTGILILLYAWGVSQASEYKIAIGLVFHVFIYFKAKYEERLLNNTFPEYRNYQNTTGMFFPNVFNFKK